VNSIWRCTDESANIARVDTGDASPTEPVHPPWHTGPAKQVSRGEPKNVCTPARGSSTQKAWRDRVVEYGLGL
jgi:hypothetical protein